MTSGDTARVERRDPIFLNSAVRVGALVIAISLVGGAHFTLFQVKDQDRPVLVGLTLLLLLIHFLPPRALACSARPSRRGLLAMLAIASLSIWGLTYALMRDFGVSYDEFMVLFDMQVYAGGQLAAPFPAEWRDYTLNLVPSFLLNQIRPEALVSTYLPMNAIARLAFSQILPATLMNPLLFFVGGVALLDIARNQFGEDRETILVVFLLYLMSMQAWAAAMTPYAMTAHLALNLVWLAAFLRGGRWHLLAIATAAVATGLHQLVFHPLFAAPFLLQRLLERRWRLVALYAGAYAVICAAWIAFPMLAAAYTGTAAVAGGSHGDFFHDRVLPLLASQNDNAVLLAILNLARFFAWQHLALLPLVTLAILAIRRGEGLSRALGGGIVLTFVLITLVLPFQGHGWGYRYLHGWIGSFAVLAGFGYRELRSRTKDGARTAVTVLTIATVPAMVWLASRIDAFVGPHVLLEQRIASSSADMILIETESATATRDGRWAPNGIDLVRNRPDLANRPLRLSSQLMTPDLAAGLCRRGSITLLDRDDQRRVGFAPNQLGPSMEFRVLRDRMESEARLGRCRIVAFDKVAR